MVVVIDVVARRVVVAVGAMASVTVMDVVVMMLSRGDLWCDSQR